MRLLLIAICSVFLAGSGSALDLDHDGIPDAWETSGVTVTFADGHSRFLDLPAMGASPRHKNLIVWIFWMQASDHSHRPIANTQPAMDGSGRPLEQFPLQRIIEAYRNAPIQNLDGTKGINLIPIYSDTPPIREVTPIGTTDLSGNYDWTPLESLAAPQIPVGPAGIESAFHFCFFIHQMGGEGLNSSGLSKAIPGHEFLVSLGALGSKTGSPDEQEGTFMHELGHNLGLRHGGADDLLYKPNYLSVVNYLFQVTGLMVDGTLGHFDYSSRPIDFDENAVNSALGVSQDPMVSRYGSAEFCGPSRVRFFTKINSPVRWDCSDNDPLPGIQPIDVNRDGNISLLSGFDDWTNINLGAESPVGGYPITKIPKPRDELDSNRIANILGALKVSNIAVTRVAKGLSLLWSRVPLQSIVAYEVLRSTDGRPPVVIWQTRNPTFTDTTAKPGVTYKYQVRLIVNGVSQESIDSVTLQLKNVEKLLSTQLRSVLPQHRRISEILMRAEPSRSVQVTR